jgi:hypothetical protein
LECNPGGLLSYCGCPWSRHEISTGRCLLRSIGVKKVCARGYNRKEAFYGWTKLESIWRFGGGDEDDNLWRFIGC